MGCHTTGAWLTGFFAKGVQSLAVDRESLGEGLA